MELGNSLSNEYFTTSTWSNFIGANIFNYQEDMPTSVLNKSELLAFINNAPFDEIIKPLLVDSSVTKEDFIKLLKKTKKENWNTMIPYINELGRNYLELRDIVVAPQSTTYRRN